MKDDWENIRENIDFESLNMDLMSKGFYFNGAAIINSQNGSIYGTLELGDYGWVVSERKGMPLPPRVKYLMVKALSTALNQTFNKKFTKHNDPEIKLQEVSDAEYKGLNEHAKRVFARVCQSNPAIIQSVPKIIGVTPACVANWINGGNINSTNAKKIIKEFGK